MNVTSQTVKEQLLNAAITIIDNVGEANFRVDDLLKQVGVTAPTLYHHFGSREGLIVEAQAERFSREMRKDFPKFINAVRNSQSIDDLRSALSIAFALRDNPKRNSIRLKRINAIGAAYARPELAKRIVEVHDALAREVAEALRPFQLSGIIREDIDLEMVVAWYNGAVLGKVLIDIAPTSLVADNWVTVMTDATNHLLFPES